MEIERLWHQTPGWLASLDRSEQARMLAWYRLHTSAPDDDR